MEDEIRRRDARSAVDIAKEAKLVERARRNVFKHGYAVSGKKVTTELNRTSRMPIRVRILTVVIPLNSWQTQLAVFYRMHSSNFYASASTCFG